MGLLDQFTQFAKTPEGQGLLSAAFGGLATAQRGAPLNSIGRAGMAGLAGYSGAIDREQQQADNAFQQQYRTMQMDAMKQTQAKQQAEQQWRQKLPGLMTPTLQGQTEQSRMLLDQMGPDASPDDVQAMNQGARMPASGFEYGSDKTALQKHLMDPSSPFADELLKKQLFPGEKKYLTVGGAVIDPETMQAVYNTPKEVDYNQLIIPDGKGGYVINSLLLGAKTKVATAGRPSVTVNNKVENKASESVAKEIGPLLSTSLTAAEGASRVEDAANRVIKALDSGKVITGPLANARVTGLQIADVLGIGGANDQERLVETRKAIRALSEMTLQGRKEMAGQGAITDRESALAEKATSGDINNLTAAEVRELAAASKRASQYTRNKHKSRVSTARNLPGMGTVADFFDIPEMPTEQAPTASPTMRFNPATGKLEQVR